MLKSESEANEELMERITELERDLLHFKSKASHLSDINADLTDSLTKVES